MDTKQLDLLRVVGDVFFEGYMMSVTKMANAIEAPLQWIHASFSGRLCNDVFIYESIFKLVIPADVSITLIRNTMTFNICLSFILFILLLMNTKHWHHTL